MYSCELSIDEINIGDELFYIHGPKTGEWSARFMRFDLVKVISKAEKKVSIEWIQQDLSSQVMPCNLFRRENLVIIQHHIDGVGYKNIIVGSACRRKTGESKSMTVYGTCIDTGLVYRLAEFSGRGFMKMAKELCEIINGK